MAEQDANNVAITGGTISGVTGVGSVTSVGGTGTVSGISLSGTVTTSGNLTLGGTLDLSSPPAIGGTTASTGRFTTVTSTVATGTAPFTVASTTPVANLSIGGNAATVTNGVYTTDTGTVTNAMLAGSIANAKLSNSTITVNGSAISLGGSATITATATNALTIGTGLSGASYNGSSAITVAIDSTVATLSDTQTLTNKRIDPRAINASNATATLTPDVASADMYAYTALATALTINAPIGTPVVGDKLIFRFLDNGTARALTWNATYTVIGVTLPTTTVINKTTYVGCMYNAFNTRWDVIAVTTQA